jgi:signal transduction histidine kinase
VAVKRDGCARVAMNKPRWNERARSVLLLELAVVLPAAALILFNVIHLKSIQRDRAVEAAIQRDFYQVMSITEKHANEKIHALVEEARHEFPPAAVVCTDSMDHMMEQHSEIAHLFIYNPHRDLVFRSRQERMDEPDMGKESEQLQKMVRNWIPMEFEELVKKLKSMEKKGKLPVFFEGTWVPRGDKHFYSTTAYFLLPPHEGQPDTIGGLQFDAEYLRDRFLPELLNSELNHSSADAQAEKSGYAHAAMMVHVRSESEPLATSAEWEGGHPEVERSMEGALPGLVLGMKLRGTTLAALGQRFVRISFLILGGLSLLLAGGILLTYRNVTKEMALARLKSDFVSNVSHELRTPLSLIRLYAETLEMGRLNTVDKQQEYFRIIRKESERLTGLINNILDFSRIEAGKKEYDFRQTDLAELVRNTLDSYRYQIEQNGFAFKETIAPDIPPMAVDREAIARSLLNLVNNALKYSHDDKFLGVNLYRSNGTVKLEVVDHGMGIPSAEQPKIFEKFYRVGNPLVHNTKGSGLGLSLVRHIVKAHGGEVLVESTPGQGSKFTIALPVETAQSGAKPAIASAHGGNV